MWRDDGGWCSLKPIPQRALLTGSTPCHCPQKNRFDAQAYLAWEAQQSDKHEYHDGEVLATAGASETHTTMVGDAFMPLRNHLRGCSSSLFISDMKMRVKEDNAFLYPRRLRTCSKSFPDEVLIAG